MPATPVQAIVPMLSRLPTILVVDDEEGVRSFFHRLLTREGYIVETAETGPAALVAVAMHQPDVVLLDVSLPELNGFEVCRRLRQEAATRLVPVIIVTGRESREDRVKGLDAGADDFLTKPVDNSELLARVRSLVRLKQYTDDLDSAASIITTLATMIESRDGLSMGHCSRMANYATNLGRYLGLDGADLQVLYRGGFLHDIGMLAIPEAVLRKTGPLDAAEYELIKSHTTVGESLCSNLRSLQSVRQIVRSHHERRDGSGYPDGLRNEEIPVLAQIIGVADVFEAMTTPRAYQPTQSAADAIATLQLHVQRGWREQSLVDAFVASLDTRVH
jgi:putative two-component system response regulator